VVVTGRPAQRMNGWGASVVTDVRADPLAVTDGLSADALAGMDRLVFRDAGIGVVRVFAPGYGSGQGTRAATRLRSGDPRLLSCVAHAATA